MYRQRECMTCGCRWDAPVVMGQTTNLTGEMSTWCPKCHSGNVMGGPWQAHTYTLDAGRCIVRNGVPFATIHGAGEYQPTEMDQFARDVAAAMNFLERSRIDGTWRQGVNNMARPGDVANLVMERDRLLKERESVVGVAVIYECNSGPVVYGPFEHADEAVKWCEEREAKPGEDEVKFTFAMMYPQYKWEV